jgi:PIN domain nuclease of toxin-antitoxin system
VRYVLDTHALVWHLTNDPRLGSSARSILDDDDSHLVVPIIVLAEAKYIADRKRVPMPFDEILSSVIGEPRCVVFPLDIYVISYLQGDLDIHDSLIVATALYCQDFFSDEVAVLTKDEEIIKSALVHTVW